jgi:hypothetical protein
MADGEAWDQRRGYVVWFMPNPPRDAFEVRAATVDEAILIDEVLARYSLYLGEAMIPVSVGGIIESDDDGDLETLDGFDADEYERRAAAIRARLFPEGG